MEETDNEVVDVICVNVGEALIRLKAAGSMGIGADMYALWNRTVRG